MSNNHHTIHFTFGSPQDFISQARRTRDVWAGSYIMSYLAGRAMRALLELENNDSKGEQTIIFPAVKNDPLMRALRGDVIPDKGADMNSERYLAALVGSLPNRFSAQISSEAAGKVCADTIQKTWEHIGVTAWNHITAWTDNLLTETTKEIWDRQIKNTWECSWVIGDSHYLLDQRKNLRTHFSEAEAGEKCTICGLRQALSANGKNDRRNDVKEWWKDVAGKFNGGDPQNNQEGNGLHFREDRSERLCAVCTIKRIFPLIAKQALSTDKVHGWKQPHNYPATSYMAAVDWIINLLDVAQNNPEVSTKLLEFLSVALKACKYDPRKQGQGEITTKICGIETKISGKKEYKLLSDLDGNFFFPDALRNKKEFLTHLTEKGEEGKKIRAKVKEALSQLTGIEGLKAPTPFYALLLMDGDRMGKILNDCPDNMNKEDHQEKVSNALSQFTRQVPRIVYQSNGVLVYAGGDDVFAFLPLNTALACACEIRLAYLKAFQECATHVPEASISAAVVYAHMNTALGTVVRDAHKLLDEVAKKRTGRNAFAVRVWKRGGPIITFAKPWCGMVPDWVGELNNLKGKFGKQEYSSGFFYRLRELFEILEPKDSPSSILTDDQKVKLLAAEYMKNRQQSVTREEAEERVSRLLRLCREEYRDKTGSLQISKKLTEDGTMFLRFLAQKEV